MNLQKQLPGVDEGRGNLDEESWENIIGVLNVGIVVNNEGIPALGADCVQRLPFFDNIDVVARLGFCRGHHHDQRHHSYENREVGSHGRHQRYISSSQLPKSFFIFILVYIYIS
ncbi:hypothetical protein IC582_027509 [Cucumis melo]